MKKYLNDKYKYFIHELFLTQALKLLHMFKNDYQALIDATVKITDRKIDPPVDFRMIDKYLYGGGDETPRLHNSRNKKGGLGEARSAIINHNI